MRYAERLAILGTAGTLATLLMLSEARAWLVQPGYGILQTDAAGDIYALTGDLAVAKLSGANGAEVWTHSAAMSPSSDANALGLDSDGNVLVGGSDNHPDDSSDFVVAKLAGATGGEIWRTALVEPYGNAPYALAVDPSGDVVTVGYLNHPRYGDADGAVVKFSGATGVELWRYVVPDAIGSLWRHVATDHAGDVVVAAYQGTVTKLAGATGGVLWSHALGPSTGLYAITVDGAGDIVGGGLTIDGSIEHVLVVKLAAMDGHELWRTAVDGSMPGNQYARAIALTPGGDVVAAGATTNGAGGTDFTVLRFDGASGAERWRFTADGTSRGDDEAVGVVVDGAGDVFAVGGIVNVGGVAPFCCGFPLFTAVKLDGGTGAERWRRLRPVSASTIALASQTDPIIGGSGVVKLRGADGAEACGTGACGFCESCDPSGACTESPRPWCDSLNYSRARLYLRTSTTHASDRWQWKSGGPIGARTALDDFGDPRAAGAPHALCVFDRPSGAARLFHDARIPTGGTCGTLPCWRQFGALKFVYRDPTLGNDGMAKIVERAGPSGGTAITVSGQGPNLGLPASLALVPPVTVQYQLETGQCWETSHGAAAVKANGPNTFRAVGP